MQNIDFKYNPTFGKVSLNSNIKPQFSRASTIQKMKNKTNNFYNLQSVLNKMQNKTKVEHLRSTKGI